jgi:hypothetical protein
VAKTLTFEFVDAAGAVVGTKEVVVPALKAGATHAIEFEVAGENIHGWRYTAK